MILYIKIKICGITQKCTLTKPFFGPMEFPSLIQLSWDGPLYNIEGGTVYNFQRKNNFFL